MYPDTLQIFKSFTFPPVTQIKPKQRTQHFKFRTFSFNVFSVFSPFSPDLCTQCSHCLIKTSNSLGVSLAYKLFSINEPPQQTNLVPFSLVFSEGFIQISPWISRDVKDLQTPFTSVTAMLFRTPEYRKETCGINMIGRPLRSPAPNRANLRDPISKVNQTAWGTSNPVLNIFKNSQSTTTLFQCLSTFTVKVILLISDQNLDVLTHVPSLCGSKKILALSPSYPYTK